MILAFLIAAGVIVAVLVLVTLPLVVGESEIALAGVVRGLTAIVITVILAVTAITITEAVLS